MQDPAPTLIDPIPPFAPRLRPAAGRLLLDGQPWFLRAAEFHYFRIDRALWEPGLARLAALGFNAVSTYVPWIWHEPEPGRYDFTGAGDPRRDLLGFTAGCRAAGLPLIVRPGPFIYAEYQGFGIPRWLKTAIPQALMRDRAGRPVAGPFWEAYSLGHPAYRAAVAGWYHQVATACAGLWNDPILAWQLDNETGLLYANGLGHWDWNPDTVQRFRAWLAREYGAVDRLNAAWGAHYPDFAAVAPPRVPFRRGLTQDYQRFLEAWIDDYLGWLRGVAVAAGVPVPFSHNDSANFIPPINPARKIATGVADLPGYDLYVKMTGHTPATDYPWGSACAAAYFRAVTPPALPLLCWELGAGWLDPRARTGDAALANSLLGSLAQGLQGFSLYIAHNGVEADGHRYTY
ncbi:MAG TPA: beta-galactosidase, partial [Chloroflexia bacterium]|nr:beta-galactosidase [Chloroflexia bacterium]